MMGAALTVRDKSVRLSAFAKPSTKNAWARYVRNRWRVNTLALVQAEWDLTEGQARGLIYAQASQSTIDAILDHPRGGFALGLTILETKTAMGLEAFIAQQAERARRERAEWEARERAHDAMRARLSELRRHDG